jgi:hypothetical protein
VTPASIYLGIENSPSTEILNFLRDKKELIHSIKLAENSNLYNLYSKPVYRVVSKVFSVSKNTAAVDILLLKLRVTWSVFCRFPAKTSHYDSTCVTQPFI